MLYRRTPESSFVRSMYFGKNKTFVAFNNGDVYAYPPRPDLEAEAARVQSVGKFFVNNIRNLPFERIK